MNPRTGAVDYRVETASREDITAVTTRLRAAQPAWRALGAEGRAKVLLQWADAVQANMGALVERLSVDTGRVAIANVEPTLEPPCSEGCRR